MPVKSPDDLFSSGAKGAPEHPRLQRWKNLREQGYVNIQFDISRKWDGLTYSPARMFVMFQKDGHTPSATEEFLWEQELNQGLVDLGVRAKGTDEEIVRYTLAFKSVFEHLSLRHGQDYVRSVLVEYLRDSFLVEHPKLTPTLSQVRTNPPSHGSGYDQVVDTIDRLLRTKARELETQLTYDRDISIKILSGALAQYLDEIFHLSARRALFGR